ncbi:MAG: NAD(P)/FAD-dependent oxidoreductase [Desulforhopalus sp.]
MVFDVIIIGGGPAGLACAEITAAHGLQTLVIERKNPLGAKVCAGGITWHGLIRKIPENIAEKHFRHQHIFTRYQQVRITARTPIIATVNRQNLGQLMAERARSAGAEIREGCLVTSIHAEKITYVDKSSRQAVTAGFRVLVGADGSTSMVRRYLGLPIQRAGIGINYQLKTDHQKMEWHLDPKRFASGYAWVFPHRDTVSVGAYVDSAVMPARKLRDNLQQWATDKGFSLRQYRPRAEYINFDYRGYHFGKIFLAGDAAGLASGLTGEGIYPAIVSGESVASTIIDPCYNPAGLHRLIRNHRRHSRLVRVAGTHTFVAALFVELITFCLRIKLIDFSAAEMAG